MDYQIKQVSSIQELEQVYAFFKEMFKGQPVEDNPEFSLEKWAERMRNYGELMLYASSGVDVIGLVLGRIIDDKSMIIGPVAVRQDHRGLGIAKEMMLLQEKGAARLGLQSICLGGVEAAEKFYEKLGYTGSLLIQSQDHSIEQLLSLNKNIR